MTEGESLATRNKTIILVNLMNIVKHKTKDKNL